MPIDPAPNALDSTGEGRRSWWPFGIAAGLGAVVVANVIMVRIAVNHPSTLASADHYADAQSWDQELEARRSSAELGWTVSLEPCVSTRETPEERCELRLAVRDQNGRVPAGLVAKVEARRHDGLRDDQTLTLQPAGDHSLATTWPAPRRGLWSFRLEIRDERGRRWVGEREAFVEGMRRSRSSSSSPQGAS